MKTYKEMAKNALDRISDHKIQQEKRRKSVAKIAAPAVGFCLAVMLGIGVWRSVSLKTEVSVSSGQNLREFSDNNNNAIDSNIGDDEKIVTRDSEGQKGANTDPSNGCCYFWWNNLSIGGSLKAAIDNNPGSVFKILATYRPVTANITSFIYEGKSLAQWAVEAFEENESQDAKRGYKLAYNAYLETVMPSAVSRLSEYDIKCERAAYTNNSLIIFAAADQLKNLPLEDLENWYFDLAADELKGTSNNEDATGLYIVN